MEKKVILVLATHTRLWGAERSMCELLKEWKNRGAHIVLLLSKHGDIEILLKEYSIEYYVTPLSSSCCDGTAKRTIIQKLIALYRNYKKRQKTNKTILDILNNVNVKPDLIYSNTIVPENGIYLAEHFAIPHVVHIREITDGDFNFYFYRGKSNYMKALDKSLTTAICISNAVLRKFHPYFGDKAKLVYNGLPIFPEVFHKEDKKVRILWVGRLSEEKGIKTVLQAVSLLSKSIDYLLDIWGDGPLMQYCKDYISRKELTDCVKLHGYSSFIERSNYQLAIMSSNAEAFGRTTVEYMMAGIPVIGKNSGATPELIKNGENGFLYETTEELCKSIEVLATNKRLRCEMGANAREIALKRFSQKRYIDECSNIILQILHK